MATGPFKTYGKSEGPKVIHLYTWAFLKHLDFVDIETHAILYIHAPVWDEKKKAAGLF